jgi:tryptophan halogenase
VSGANADKAIRSVCVAGGGIVGLSAALAFGRALPKARVTLVATLSDPAALADRLPSTQPEVGRFHAAIGFNELDLVKAGTATHRLATRFKNWSADGSVWHHALGGHGASMGDSQFHKVWLKGRRAGQSGPFERHIPAAVLAAQDKFVHPDSRPGSPIGTYLYALRLDPQQYRARPEAACDAQGIARTAGALGAVERREDGGIRALLL